jgi:dTDP-4-dehydrorhamnose 3,5-epimerase
MELSGDYIKKPPFTQSKLVHCVRGKVLDVAVDIRKDSPTFGQHIGVKLNEKNHLQFFILKGFEHGFAVLSNIAIFQYKCDKFYAPQSEGEIQLIDECFDINWYILYKKGYCFSKIVRFRTCI